MQIRGTNGFGYDPIFYSTQKKKITFGQMLKSKKIKWIIDI